MTKTTGHITTPDGTRLAYTDHTPGTWTSSPHGPTLLLLHGLAGHRGEWDDLLTLLLADGTHRIVTYDARGHGDSTRIPEDMTRAAAVQDATTVVRALNLPRPTLLGQSLGGHTALLTAAAHPSLVAALILVEAGPGGPTPDLPEHIGGWLDTWPQPFPTPAAATSFFGHETWSKNLEKHADGWYVRADRQTMLAAIAEPATNAYWRDWTRVTCPTLVIHGENGTMPAPELTEMQTRRPSTRVVTIEDAGHDVHLDQPGRLHEAMAPFLRRA
jgi:pimeloyl-ACP methyl ester carboxylesterase